MSRMRLVVLLSVPLLIPVVLRAQRWQSMIRSNLAFATSPSSGLHIVCTGGWLIQSWDDGTTWQHERIEQNLDPLLSPTEDLTAIAFSDSATGLILGTDHLFRTTDGGHIWVTLRYPGYEVYSNLCALSNGTFCFIDSKGRFFSGETTFSSRVLDDTDYLTWLQSTTDDYLFARTRNTDLLESSDGGATWHHLPNSQCDYASFTDHLDGVSVHDHETFATHDGGLTWSVISATRSDYPTRLDSELILFRTFVYNARTGRYDSLTSLHSSEVDYWFARLNRVVFVLTDHGLLLSTDTGQTGTELFRNDPGSNVVARNARDLASVDWGLYQQYRSLDSGITWKPVGAPLSSNSILFLDSVDGILVGEDTIFRTTNGGNSWTPLSLQHKAFGTFGNAYVCSGGIFITGDGGPWFTSDFTTFRVSNPCHQVDGVDIKGDTILVSGYDTALNTVLMLSKDTGVTWKKVGTTGGWIQYIGNGVLASSTAGSGLSISNDEGNTWQMVLPDAGVMRFLNQKQGVAEGSMPGQIFSTTDAGSTWRKDHFDLPPSGTLFDLLFPGNAYGWAGYYRADLATLFVPGVDTVAPSPQLRWYLGPRDNVAIAVGEAPDGSLLQDDASPGAPEKLERSTNFGATWVPNTLYYDPSIRHFFTRGKILYGVGLQHVLRSTNNGTSWTSFFQEYYGFRGITTDAIFTKSGKLLIATSDGLFRSTTNDTTFARKYAPNNPGDSGITDTILPRLSFVWLAKDSTGALYAMTYDSVLRSVDDGTSWSLVLHKLQTEPEFTDLCVMKNGAVYVCGASLLYRSPDGVHSWTTLKPPYESGLVAGPRLEACGDSTLLLLTGSGAYYSNNPGMLWSAFDTLHGSATDIISTHDGHLIGATNGLGMVRTVAPFTAPASSVSEPTQVNSDDVYAVYPNPSEGTIQIRPVPADRHTSIYRSDGSSIGERTIDPTGSITLNLPSGTYWIVMDDGMAKAIIR